MQRARPLGNIITFYSYKGGTGRTMALANSACVLAERIGPEENVLVVDWDLEAPGLHQFLPARLRNRSPSLDTGLGAEPGLIDLFIALRDALPSGDAHSEDEAVAAANTALSQVKLEHFIGDTEVPKIHIVRAGRNDDGGYSKRVNTFDWEGLFRRSPGLYRKVAEQLAERYRYVLIDSRTGVTDISGICTSLLPEKLVVVFTPNRQSLTGVRELVGRATSYRLGSDDLRPLLVYPLPSRIEVSLEKLNAHWRYGNPDAGVAGYQPMFQGLLKDCYALTDCDLTAYFNDVQIQQSADCAYGEVISVRQTSGERLSLASSYRVFVDRLLAEVPPWLERHDAAPVSLPRAATAVQPPSLPTAATIPTPTATMAPAAPAANTVPGRDAKRVFLSYAREDRALVAPVADALKEHGYSVWFDLDIQPGVDFQQAVTRALDGSDVVIVFWSRASVTSDFVRAEAGEGSRRGVLLPVLLDDTYPPLEFRNYNSADLRRPSAVTQAQLLASVARVAGRQDASNTSFTAAPSMAGSAAPTRRRTGVWIAAALVAAAALPTLWFAMRPAPTSSTPTPGVAPTGPVSTPIATAPVAPRLQEVPDFKGRTTADVQKVAEVLGLNLKMTDEKHTVEQRYLDGVVTQQTPAAGTLLPPQGTVTLTVATQTATVPSVVGISLGKALDVLEQNGLVLGRSETVVGTRAPAGSVVRQTPAAGTAVPAGTKVDVGVAASPVPRREGKATAPGYPSDAQRPSSSK